MKPDFTHPFPDPEARLTALLLGELTPEEAAATRRALASDPQLTALHDRLRQTIELLREAATQPVTEAVAPPAMPRLSPERRDALQAAFKTVKAPVASSGQRSKWREWLPYAAAAGIVLFIGVGMLLPSLAKAKAKGQNISQLNRERIRQLDEVARARVDIDSLASGVEAPAENAPEGQGRGTHGVEMNGRVAGLTDVAVNGPAESGTPDGVEDSKPQQTDRRMMMRYGLMPNEGKPAATAPGAPPPASRDGEVARLNQFFFSATNRSDDTVAAETIGLGNGRGESAWFRAPDAEGLGGGGGGGGMGGGAGGETWRFDDNATASPSLPAMAASAPARQSGRAILGDEPALGRMFTKQADFGSFMEPGLQAGLATAGKPVAVAEGKELAPLPLKLPVPAFMGTPVDMDFAKIEKAHRDDSRKEAATEPAASRRLALAREGPPGPAVSANAGEDVDRLALGGADKLAKLGEPAATSRGLITQLDVAADAKSSARPKVEREVELKQGVAALAAPVQSEALGFQLAAKDAAKQLVEEREAVAVNRPQRPPPEPRAEVVTSVNPFSTFSLNVADVSYQLAAASLESDALPEPAGIRTEEFINAFNYRDPAPVAGAPISFAWERARDPFAHNRDLLRFSVQTAALGREAGRPLNLVLVLDNSGSMERADRVGTIREALRVLAGKLQPRDVISVVAFARTPRLWVDGLPGAQAAELPERVGNLTPEGGTNIEEAMKLGYATARRHFLPNGVNRVILITDGAANLGDVNPESLDQMVQANRQRGVALDCFGVGWDGYNDDLLEVLARHGDGRYGFVNTPEEAAGGFANQLAGALQVAAADVKVQIEFNAARVTAWRQIGYAKHQLTKEQFRDNTVDAAEIGAAEAGNALYVVEVNPQGDGPLGVVRVRYRVPATGQYAEHEWAVPYTGPAAPLAEGSPAMRLAAVAANFGEWLAASPYAGEVTPARLLPLLAGVPQAFAPDPRPQRLEALLRQAQSLGGQ